MKGGGGESGFKRGRVGGDIDDVVEGEVGDDRFHLCKVGAGAGAALHVVKLADDVAGGASGDGRHVLEALEIGAVASGAEDGSSVGAGGDERSATLEAAGRNVGDEFGRVVAEFRAFKIFRGFDDAVAEGLYFVGSRDDHHPSGDVSFGNELGFDDADPRLGFQSGIVFSGGLDFRVGSLGSDGDHVAGWLEIGIGAFAGTTFEVGELLDDVVGGKAGEAGIIRAALAVGEVAVAAGVDIGLTAVSDNGRHGGVTAGMPVRGVEEVADLRMSEGDFAAGDTKERGLVGFGGGVGWWSGWIDGVRPVGRRLGESLRRCRWVLTGGGGGEEHRCSYQSSGEEF
jgi:hypothetical protein